MLPVHYVSPDSFQFTSETIFNETITSEVFLLVHYQFFTQLHFTPRSFHPTLYISNASQINYNCRTISILVLKEKRLESDYQLNIQTMPAM